MQDLIKSPLPASALNISSAAKSHLPELDVLRGVAISMVFFYHCLGAFCGKEEIPYVGNWRDISQMTTRPFVFFYPLTWGWAGVATFFVLSGFVIHYSTLRTKTFSMARFYSRRFWRIYPPYLAALLFFAIKSHVPLNSWQFLSHILLVHNYFAQTHFGINGVFWSLAVEMQLYLLYPLLLWLRARYGMGGAIRSILLLDLLARLVLLLALDTTRHPSDYLCWYLSPLTLWFDWTLGAYLAEAYHQGRRLFSNPLPAWLQNLLLLAGLAILDTFRPFQFVEFTYFALWSLLVVERCIWSNRPLSITGRGTAAIGLCSYSFYLWHAPLIPAFAKVLHRLGLANTAWINMLVASPLLFVLIAAISWLLYKTVEVSSSNLAHRLTQARATSVSA